MSFLSHVEIAHLLATYGYVVAALMVGVEGMGIPVPGEATLIAASIVAGTSHELNIGLVVAAAAGGAVLGDNAGFWIGRSLGYRLLRRFGPYIWLTERRIKLGQYLFSRHGGILVFLGRFIALLRTLAPFVAGANRMPWRRFAPFNAAGSVVWATIYGSGAYALGRHAHSVMGPAGLLLAALGIAAVGAAWLFLRRNEARLEAEAERSEAGPPGLRGRGTS
jgi:membrane protein DedA with SNARE-associated domain